MNLGAYAVERDYSHYVAYAAKTVFAVVGTASKGPIGEAVLCTSSQDLVNKFGPLKTNCYGLYAGQYFLSQSSKLYFVRAAGASAQAASATIAGKSSTAADLNDALIIETVEKGTYANEYSIVVTEEDSKYTLGLKNKSGISLEVWKDKDLDELTEGLQGDHFRVKTKNLNVVKLTTGTYALTEGHDGIEDIEDADYISAANALAADTIDINLFAVPGVSEIPVITAMLALAETRGDCLFLVDPPEGLTREGVVQWHNGGGEYQHTVLNSSYGALYYDWVRIYDSVNKTQVTVPPSVVVAASYAYSDRTSEIWYAPAGLNRGLVRGVIDSVTKLSRADVDYLYSTDNNINALYDDPQVGLVLWGQKTLHREDTALNRVNVRRLMNYLKRVVTAACNYLTFEPNDRVTWNSFEMKITPVLKNIQNKRGIYEYHIIKGETIVTNNDIDNYRMPCKIMIRPTKAAEEIPLYFVITSTGADFNDVLEANGVISEL